MIRVVSLSSSPKLRQVYLRHASSQTAISHSKSSYGQGQAEDDLSPLNSISKRRIKNSPTLPLEAVALPSSVQKQLHQYTKQQNVTPRRLRENAAAIHLARATESHGAKIMRHRGQPIVQPSPHYDPEQTAAFAALRMPGTFAANIFVMAEAARLSPDFTPNSILDFGSGPGTSFMAASRVFSPLADAPSTNGLSKDRLAFDTACLVDRSANMHALAAKVMQVDPCIRPDANITHLSNLQDNYAVGASFDIVSCSYSLNEIVRDIISSPKQSFPGGQRQSVSRDDRLRCAESMLRRTTLELWSRTAPNGLFIVIEDGTAAGFETIAFVRDTILKRSPPMPVFVSEHDKQKISIEDADNGEFRYSNSSTIRAQVIAPCLHSRPCPLNGSITRHRICRFKQRLNRPLLSRTAMPMSSGFEDEYFSFIVVRKLVGEQGSRHEVCVKDRWGRLIRQPLLKGKHVAMDVCTREGALERRVVSKKSAAEGQYSKARHAKWGDVWSTAPASAPQQLNF